MTEAQAGVTRPEAGRREGRWPREAERDKGPDRPLAPAERTSPANALTLAQWN